jgi:hypothetical protein
VDSTNKTKTRKGAGDATTTEAAKDSKPRSPREPREPRERKQRGPPEDGVPSKTKVMVANLPYDLGEEQVG